jgi:predicted nucleic acid-binding protein
VIHLDSNVLIALPVLARQRHDLTTRIARGEAVAASSVAWFEYLCGPVEDADPALVRAVLSKGIVPLDEDVAERAALLFNTVGRKRRLRTDSLIAATAILAGAELATFNAVDFRPFVAHGLKLLAL